MDMHEPNRFAGLQYAVPGNVETDVYICPLSGGADSTVLALLLKQLAPHVPWRYVFTDTGAEEIEIYEQLDRLEAILGPIERLSGKSLWEVIADFGSFLPSPTDRYCTRILKLKPFQQWVGQFKGRQKWIAVGIRADEPTRLAFTIDECETIMPLLDLGITRDWVYDYLVKTLGIPKSYKTRSRSGCTVCPYQTVQELTGLLQRNPADFAKGAACEKLSVTDSQRHPPGVALWQDTTASANWLSLPAPDHEQVIEAGRIAKAADLFGRRIFVAGEFFYAGMPGMQPFVWHQRVITFSTTLQGIKKQLDGRYQHLLSTAEVHGMDSEDVRHDARFAIWYIQLPAHVFDPDGPRSVTDGERSYTWHAGKSYRQIAHVISWATRVLHAEYERRLADSNPPLMSVKHEWKALAQETLAEAKASLGDVLLSQWYQPTEKIHEPETELEMLRQTPCPMCQI